MHDDDTRDALPLVRRFNILMDELDEMKARAGGWVAEIPAADLAAWQERKRQLVAEVAAHEAARVSAR